MIARKIAENFSLFTVNLNVDKAFITNDVSRMSLCAFFALVDPKVVFFGS